MQHKLDEQIRQRLEDLSDDSLDLERVWKRIEEPKPSQKRYWPLRVGMAAILGIIIGYFIHQPTDQHTSAKTIVSIAQKPSVHASEKAKAEPEPPLTYTPQTPQLPEKAPVPDQAQVTEKPRTELTITLDSLPVIQPSPFIQPTDVPVIVQTNQPSERFEATVTLTIPEPKQETQLRRKSILARIFGSEKKSDQRPQWKDFKSPAALGKAKVDSSKIKP